MSSWLKKLLAWLRLAPPRIRCDPIVWADGVRELERRTLGGRRESGAFLLGTVESGGTKRIRDFIFYDDVDLHALDTGVSAAVRIRAQTARLRCRVEPILACVGSRVG
jgi:hypothetical protein